MSSLCSNSGRVRQAYCDGATLISPPDAIEVPVPFDFARTGEDALTCTLNSRDFIGRTGVVRHNSCRFLMRNRKSESACSRSGQPGARAVPARHAFVMEMELL